MRLPTALDINPIPEDLDGNAALDHFLGKSIAEATSLFKENSLYYQEDLMWMGPRAFCFYVHAAIDYIKSENSSGDSDMVNCLHDTLAFRLKNEYDDIATVLGELNELVDYILAHWQKFDVDPEISGELKTKYQQLLNSL